MIAEADMCFLRFFKFNLLVFRRLTKPMERGGSGEYVFAATALVERWRADLILRGSGGNQLLLLSLKRGFILSLLLSLFKIRTPLFSDSSRQLPTAPPLLPFPVFSGTSRQPTAAPSIPLFLPFLGSSRQLPAAPPLPPFWAFI